MITIADYQNLLESNYEIIKEQVAGISEAEALLQPPNGGNCLLWVVGHLTQNLGLIIEFMGGDLPQDLPDLDRFKRGSEPIKAAEPGLPSLSELLVIYDRLETLLLARLAVVTEDDAEEMVPFHGKEATRGWAAFFHEFHHAYHIGQLEFLRNLAGHTEKVI